ncbi:MAG: hypothetical protein PHQ14_06400 [Chromatiales bacterium]|nr:hypothetical protein [Chromatiales bacterium]
MRTTLDIDDALLTKAKTLAAKEHTSLTAVIEQGLAMRLRTPSKAKTVRRKALPVHAGKGGLHPSIKDSRSQRALLDAADDVT